MICMIFCHFFCYCLLLFRDFWLSFCISVIFYQTYEIFAIDMPFVRMSGLLKVLELLEKCWNLKCFFKGN